MIKAHFKKFGMYFSEVIVTTGTYSFLIWYFASEGYIFSSYNREISWLIVLLFGIGILMVVYHLLRLYQEDCQITTVYERMTSFKTAVGRLLQKKYTVTPEMLANGMRKAVDEHFAILEPSLIKQRISRIVNMMLTPGSPDLDTLSSLLQQKEGVKGSRIRYIAGILIMLGLLGTFLGLVQAVKYLQHFFMATESVDFNTLFSDMKQTLGGLDKAFGTSIGGITAYLVLGYLNVVLRTKRTYVLNQIEDISVEHFIPLCSRFQAEKSQNMPAGSVEEILQRIPETLSKQLGSTFEEIIMRTIGESSEQLKVAGTSLQPTLEGLQKGQHLLSEMLNSTGNFLSTFQEGKNQLFSIQETIASGLKDFSQALIHLDENQKMLASSLDMTRNYIENAELRLSALDEIVQNFHKIWTDNRQVFEGIAETIQSEHGILIQTTKHFEEFLVAARTEMSTYFQDVQQGVHTLSNENAVVNRKLLESHTLLTSLLHDMKTFILDEQNGLRLLASSMDETFGEARFQYLQLTEHLEELYKRIHESQEQLSYVQETTAVIQHELQNRRVI